MSEKKPVIVYGASGYTGRLVCEYLREYNIPFIAAGRSADKLNAAMKSNVTASNCRLRGRDGAAHRGRADRIVQGRLGGAQYRGPLLQVRRRGGRGPAWRPSATTRTPRASKTG